MKYKVQWFMDDEYEVLLLTRNPLYDENDWEDLDTSEYIYESVFQGSLADCEAYIRLNEGGYM